MAFPRALALAERLWSPGGLGGQRSFHKSFRPRLEARLQDLKELGVGWRTLDLNGE